MSAASSVPEPAAFSASRASYAWKLAVLYPTQDSRDLDTAFPLNNCEDKINIGQSDNMI